MNTQKKVVFLNLTIICFILIGPLILTAQNNNAGIIDDEKFQAGYGYGYDSLLTQLDVWRESPYVRIDSIGASVQNRAVWMITIKGEQNHFLPIYRVAIHARTHPDEVQSEWLSHRIIEYLIEDSPMANLLRDRFIFNIVPMYNPDGVELEYARQNANQIDLERNWFTNPHEPEVAALKAKYTEFMNDFTPINVMLNMHGDGGAEKPYFYYHHENGTSVQYTEDEKDFISSISDYYENGIGEWDYSVTWETGNPMLFPESWFWVNYSESVMAITFEMVSTSDKYDARYDSTAYALLNGIKDYFDIVSKLESENEIQPSNFYLSQNYPNPFNPTTKINFAIPKKSYVNLNVFDALGRKVKELIGDDLEAGNYSVTLNAGDLPSGVYFYKLTAGNLVQTKKAILLK